MTRESMGLLTNPQTRAKISRVISRYNSILSLLCYMTGLLYFLALAHEKLNAGNYFSENALLPGLVEPDVYNDFGAAGHLRSLKSYVKSLKEKDEEKSYKIPSVWLEERFREIGLDVYVHNYSFMYPEKLLKGQIFTGKNVYGILRGPRTASTEAVVLSAPYRPPESSQDKTDAGIALMLGLAKAFRRHTYWAKDIIFLVTENEQIGMQAWLDAYHSTSNQYIFAGEMAGKSGAIQAAINLEIPTETISRLNIKLEGLNGQLPNLDLVNTVVKLCKNERMPAYIQKRYDHPFPNSVEGFKHNLQTMLHMMWNQAPGVPTGNHGLFHRFHIEALTLQGIRLKHTKKSMGFVEVGRVIEGLFRSLNNLLERFHQSFFFYLLPATNRYVSIGLFMPPFGLLVAPVLIKALALWISYGNKTSEKTETASEKEGNNSGKKQPVDTLKEPVVGQSFNTVISLMPVCVMGMFFGLGAYFSPRYFIEISTQLRNQPQEGLMFGYLALELAAILHASLLKKKTIKKGEKGPDWKLLKCVGLLAVALVLGVISVTNISLAFFLAVVWVPVLVIVRPTKSRWLQLPQYFLLLLISPMALLFVACLIQTVFVNPVSETQDVLPNVLANVQVTLLSAVIDTHLFGNWLFALVTLTIFPAWTVFWSLMWTEPY